RPRVSPVTGVEADTEALRLAEAVLQDDARPVPEARIRSHVPGSPADGHARLHDDGDAHRLLHPGEPQLQVGDDGRDLLGVELPGVVEARRVVADLVGAVPG